VAKELVADLLQKRRYKLQVERDIQIRSSHGMVILPWESAISGATAGGAATLLFYPADTVKSAIQTKEELRKYSRGARAIHPTTFRRTALKMYRAHGLKGFYAGCGMTVARNVPSSGIIFVVYDGLHQWFS
jgi:ornithine carrier protein